MTTEQRLATLEERTTHHDDTITDVRTELTRDSPTCAPISTP